MTQGARFLKRGDTSDIECWRTTHRLGVARAILASQQIEPTWNHGPNKGLVGTGLLAREDHVCDWQCKAVWPEWVADEVFELAYRLADEIQTERGRWHQRQINAARYERV